MQPRDVPESFAEIKKSEEYLGYNPQTTIEEGIPKFISWYLEYNG